MCRKQIVKLPKIFNIYAQNAVASCRSVLKYFLIHFVFLSFFFPEQFSFVHLICHLQNCNSTENVTPLNKMDFKHGKYCDNHRCFICAHSIVVGVNARRIGKRWRRQMREKRSRWTNQQTKYHKSRKLNLATTATAEAIVCMTSITICRWGQSDKAFFSVYSLRFPMYTYSPSIHIKL